MFLRYYGLNEQPFGMTPDNRFLYLSASHREALASLIYGIESGRGFVSLIAEPGMGKTTLLFQLMERLRNSARTVFLFQTQGNTREFLANLIADLGLEPGDQDLGALQRQLNEILIQEAQLGRQFVLIIDEAQNLENSVLESVRMLSNFETSRSKLMQIVLAGQPGLAEKLGRPELEQLRQRVSILCRLNPFTPEEVVDYIDHRLETAGYKGKPLFTTEALAIIAEVSSGIPRNINNICFHALSLSYAKQQKQVDRAIVEEVLSDLKLDVKRPRPEHPPAQRDEVREPSRGLEGVVLNHGSNRGRGSVLFRGGAYSSAAHRFNLAGGRRRRRGHTSWVVWTVTLLTLVLAGELFWAYMPTTPTNHSVGELFDQTIQHAKKDLARLGHPPAGGSSASLQPETTDIHVNAKENSVPRPVNIGSGVSQNSADPSSAGAGSESSTGGSADPSNDDTAPSPGGNTVAINEMPANNLPDGTSAQYSQASSQIPTGKIVIESNVSGSAITINGRNEPEWTTPHMFDLPQGTYRISVSQDGYSTWFKRVKVTAGNKKWVTADLILPRGVFVIDTEPPGMQVFIDGKAYGPSEVEATLNAGTHTYKVVPPKGGRPLEGSFFLKPGDILTRKIQWVGSTSQSSDYVKQGSGQLRNTGKLVNGKEQS
jgi:type II secretory pathway predicted ATPase ExeA